MEKIFLPIMLLFAFGTFSQEIDSTEEISYPDRIGRDEIAYLFFVVNANNAMVQPKTFSPVYEFLSEIKYRHRFNAISLRIHFAYFWKTIHPEKYPIYNGEGQLKESRAGAGIQYNPLKRKEWVYFFMDAGYRGRKESMSILDGDHSSAIGHRNTLINALDMTLGIGTKVRIVGSLHFIADIGYNCLFGKNKSKSIFQPSLGSTTTTTNPYQFTTWTAKAGLSLTF